MPTATMSQGHSSRVLFDFKSPTTVATLLRRTRLLARSPRLHGPMSQSPQSSTRSLFPPALRSYQACRKVPPRELPPPATSHRWGRQAAGRNSPGQSDATLRQLLARRDGGAGSPEPLGGKGNLLKP